MKEFAQMKVFSSFYSVCCYNALQKNIFVSCAHFSSSIIPCDTIKVPGWKDKKMIDHPFAWPLRNNLRCKWNVYCYFRKSPWNDLYTVFNRILLKANVTIASSNLFAKKMQSALISILSHNCLQKTHIHGYFIT